MAQVRVKKWGNSAAIRLPVAVLDATGLELDALVDVRVVDGRIVIEPVRELDLDALLDAITPENLHDEADFGGPVGRELW